MNLNQNPTKDQFKALLSAADDEAGHHVLWVENSGEVHVSLIPPGTMLPEFSKTYPTVRLRFETFCQGNGYVGPEAAEDDGHVARYFGWLLDEWRDAQNARPGEIFVD